MGSVAKQHLPPSKTAESSTREKILRVARKLIARQGIHATSLAAIAAETGISRGTLFYYFASKQSLLYQVLEDSFSEVTARIEQAMHTMPPGAGAAEIIQLTLNSSGNRVP